jgi:hypothetical protein
MVRILRISAIPGATDEVKRPPVTTPAPEPTSCVIVCPACQPWHTYPLSHVASQRLNHAQSEFVDCILYFEQR